VVRRGAVGPDVTALQLDPEGWSSERLTF
jgi:hypothetical protein